MAIQVTGSGNGTGTARVLRFLFRVLVLGLVHGSGTSIQFDIRFLSGFRFRYFGIRDSPGTALPCSGYRGSRRGCQRSARAEANEMSQRGIV